MGKSCAASWWRGWSREARNDTHSQRFDPGRISVPAGAELERQAAVRSFHLPARLGEDGAVGPEPAHSWPLPGAAPRAGERAAVRDDAREKRCAGALGGSHDSAQRPAAAHPPGTEEGGEVGVTRDQLRCALSFRTVVAQATRQVKYGCRADIKSKLR